jgi:hypothetical protein
MRHIAEVTKNTMPACAGPSTPAECVSDFKDGFIPLYQKDGPNLIECVIITKSGT